MKFIRINSKNGVFNKNKSQRNPLTLNMRGKKHFMTGVWMSKTRLSRNV